MPTTRQRLQLFGTERGDQLLVLKQLNKSLHEVFANTLQMLNKELVAQGVLPGSNSNPALRP